MQTPSTPFDAVFLLSLFPSSWRLASLLDKLADLGAVHPIDLLDLDDEDVHSLGLKKLELKRWAAAIEDLKTAAAQKPPPPSPLSANARNPRASPSPTSSPHDFFQPSPSNEDGRTPRGKHCAPNRH